MVNLNPGGYERKDAASIIANAQRRAGRSGSAGLSAATAARRRVERLPSPAPPVAPASPAAVTAATPGARGAAPPLPRPPGSAPTPAVIGGLGATAAAVASAAPPARGVSAAFLMHYRAQNAPLEEASAEQRTTRAAAGRLRRRPRADEEKGAFCETLEGETHFLTGGSMTGRAAVHVAHAWDANFSELIDCIVQDADLNLDRLYNVDMFTTDLQDGPDDPVAVVTTTIKKAGVVLLVLDAAGLALTRLWVLFEAMLALACGTELRVRSSSPNSFGADENSLRQWEEHIDAADWGMAEITRKADSKRVRGFAERNWDMKGRSSEQLLRQLKMLLRKEIYGQILVGAVVAGDRKAAQLAIEMGANPCQQDAMGNTVEELANAGGFSEIADLIFERRMRVKPHAALSDFFAPAELAEAAVEGVMPPALLESFITEAEELDADPRDASTAPSSRQGRFVARARAAGDESGSDDDATPAGSSGKFAAAAAARPPRPRS
eukprot:TRINITY_DN28563_c0_g1_i1.p1 TRINITY_DN28563_c0_g1~~TRINITY_DN28563_c0_g1_i1.p1  ORF type:complete len:494 (-),score=119.33 TRINITY_DN28563_c0_g1_i1:14-1495(-)